MTHLWLRLQCALLVVINESIDRLLSAAHATEEFLPEIGVLQRSLEPVWMLVDVLAESCDNLRFWMPQSAGYSQSVRSSSSIVSPCEHCDSTEAFYKRFQ